MPAPCQKTVGSDAGSSPLSDESWLVEVLTRHSALCHGELRAGVGQTLQELAERAGAVRAAVLLLEPESPGIAAEFEYSPPGGPRLSQWLAELDEVSFRQLLNELNSEQARGVEEASVLRDLPALHQLGLGSCLLFSIPTPGVRAMLLLGYLATNSTSHTVTPLACGICRILGPMLQRSNCERLVDTRLADSARQGLVGRAVIGMAHDFNNIMHTISCISDVMLLAEPASSQTRTDIEEIKKAATRGANLTRRLVDFGNPPAMVAEDFDLGALLTDFSKLLQRVIGDVFSLKLNLPSEVVRVRTVRALIEQLLLEAAIRARIDNTSGGEFLLAATNGSLPSRTTTAGIPMVQLQIGTAGSRARLETLDCAESRALIAALRDHGCELCSIDESSVYCSLWLPTATGERVATLTPTKVEGDHAAIAPSATLMMVEDEDAARSATARMLMARGYAVLEARSVQEALALARESPQKLDLLLTDVLLTDGDGVTLSNQLRATCPGLRVIFISGRQRDILHRFPSPSGPFEFLEKPCRLAKLLDAICNSLNAK